MRIIAGKYRGKKLIAPKNSNIRPTEDRVREAVFSILYSLFGDLVEKRILDVFAGTGAFGLEALSRGAKNICLIDKDTETLSKNTALFEKEKDNIQILRADINNLPYAQNAFDIVFSDAPYDKGLNEKAFLSLQKKGFLKNGTLCIIETRNNENLLLPENFQLTDERIYGMAKISFYTFSDNFVTK